MLGTGIGFHPIQEADTVYVITDDYFAAFRAVFGPKKCELRGKAYSLRHFAVKALEMDGSFLRRLREAVAQFKPELEVFLAARSASSAATAQQRTNEVWQWLDQLFVYRNLTTNCRRLYSSVI